MTCQPESLRQKRVPSFRRRPRATEASGGRGLGTAGGCVREGARAEAGVRSRPAGVAEGGGQGAEGHSS